MDREDADCNIRPGDWRKEMNDATTNNFKLSSNNASQSNFVLRDTLMHYFMHEGAIEKQNKFF